ncbi:hypothetical protein F4804DRAFT_341486 [Jackrogersella minutella]|nr:hypothetical protein F4804DRAFT_341486 [Jackrogersella minutella]
MRFSTHGSAAVAMAASFASATVPVSDRDLLNLDLPKDLSQPISANVDLGIDLSGTVLAAGVLANVAVPPVVGAAADVEVEIVCDTCYTKGNINASISLEKVVPALSLSLSDIEVKLDLDVKIGAAATIAVNLFTPPAPISLPLPGLKVDALISLDLVIGVETAIDLSAGIDTDILAGKILDAAFSVRIGCTQLLADLRLRVELGVAAEVDVDDIVPILDLPEIGAGLEVAVFANLLEYESYGLNIGAAVELDVAVEDLLALHLAPTLSTALLSYPTVTFCQQPSYTSSIPTLSATTSAPFPSVTGPTGPSASASVSLSIPGGSGSTSGTLPASSGAGYPSGAVTATSSNAAVTSVPVGGSTTSTVTNVQTFTVTQCAANVPNCPAGYATTATLVKTTVFTTVPPKPTHTQPATPVTITKKVVTLVPCSSVETFTPPTNPPVTTGATKPASSASSTAPVPTTSAPAGYPSYPVGGESSSETLPVSSSTASVPGYPAESVSTSVPVESISTYPGTGASTYPASSASTSTTEAVSSYPASSASTSYPASAPSTSATYPASAPPAGPTGSYPVAGSSTVPYTTVVPPYPTAPTGNNATESCSTTLSTVQPSASASYPTAPGYPTGETPIPTAGAAKVGSGVAGIFAIVGAFAALILNGPNAGRLSTTSSHFFPRTSSHTNKP